MGSIVYLVDHAAVMTPLVVEAALQRCPVGTENQRLAYMQELHTMGTCPDVDPATGVANDPDRRRFHHIRVQLRQLGLPLFRQKTIWPRFRDQWDLFWGKTTEPGRDVLLRVPGGDLAAIINANQIPHPFVPDLAVRFLLRRRDSEGTGAKNPFIETELMRLAIHDPLRLYSRLGTAFYLDVLGKSSAEDAGRMVGDMMEQGLRGFDGRVIPLVSEVADRFPDAFASEQMPSLVKLAQKFPVFEEEFVKFRNQPELLEAALAVCFDEHGKFTMGGQEVAGSINRAFEQGKDRFKSDLLKTLKNKSEANWRAYATYRFISSLPHVSIFFEGWQGMSLRGSSINFDNYSTPQLMDLLIYLEFDETNPRFNPFRERLCNYISRYRHDQIFADELFLFKQEPFIKSNRIKRLSDEIKFAHMPEVMH